MNNLRIVFFMLFMLACTSVSAAPILSFGNDGQNYLYSVYEGESLDVPIWISGLDPENLGGFDMTINFDEPITELISSEFNLADVGTFIYDTVGFYGAVNLSAVSLDLDLSSQPSSFQLATLTFSALNVGMSQLNFDDVLLSDDLGLSLGLANSFVANINVMDLPPASVPGPSAFSLLLCGLFLLSFRNRMLKL